MQEKEAKRASAKKGVTKSADPYAESVHAVTAALKAIGAAKDAKDAILDVILETPPSPDLGDYSFPCFPLAKQLKKAPQQIAQLLAEKIKQTPLIEKATAAGGYLNLHLNKQMLAESRTRAALNNGFGTSTEGKGKTVLIEYSAPNIAKPFHVGHLRSTIIGESLRHILESQGHKTIGVNYLGDWGTQFGSLLAAQKKWGSEKKLKEGIPYLLNLYVRFTKESKDNESLQEEARHEFKKLEDGDKENTRLWDEMKKLSLDEFKRIYTLLKVTFDVMDAESLHQKKDVDDVVALAEKKKIAEKDEGALIVKLDEQKMPPLLLRKSDEATTYHSRDLAAALHRIKKYNPSKLLYVVGSPQHLHFKQVFTVLGMLGIDNGRFAHIEFGHYRFEDRAMKTREGDVVFMEDVLKKSIALARKTIEEKNPALKNKEVVAAQVGIGAIIFGDLANDRIKDVVFDWNKFLDFEGDTAPYLQYTHARARSILRKLGKETDQHHDECFSMPQEYALAQKLSEFPTATRQAAASYKPHVIAQYLLQLGRSFNEFYHACPCVQEPDKTKQCARASLINATASVLKKGLALLHIEAPEEM